jgi:peptide/nickel transport system ATP-binding protein
MSNVKVRFINIKKYFPTGGLLHKRYLRAVNNVSFAIREGQTLAMVGESGCGKTTIARMLMRLHEPSSGRIEVDGQDITQARDKKSIKQWHTRIQMIFQDPFASLNPAKSVQNIIGRAITLHFPELSKNEVETRVHDLLTQVGLTPPSDFTGKHPAQLSGGQRQRIVIARALAVQPEILVADEPTSMLDVSIGIDILNLLNELKESKHLTMLYITHNLASARYIADDMVVLYAGNAVEYGRVDDIIEAPYHPYTVLLLNSTPEPFRKENVEFQASEDLPDLTVEQIGCPFVLRCPVAMPRCHTQIPDDYAIGERQVKCFLYEGRTMEDRPHITITIYMEEDQHEQT